MDRNSPSKEPHSRMRGGEEAHTRTGRRKAVDIDSPRDKTVCFMVSEEEKQAIDLIGLGINRTRSALLTRIVNAFVEGVFDQSGSKNISKELIEFQKECRKALQTSNHPLLKRK